MNKSSEVAENGIENFHRTDFDWVNDYGKTSNENVKSRTTK